MWWRYSGRYIQCSTNRKLTRRTIPRKESKSAKIYICSWKREGRSWVGLSLRAWEMQSTQVIGMWIWVVMVVGSWCPPTHAGGSTTIDSATCIVPWRSLDHRRHVWGSITRAGTFDGSYIIYNLLAGEVKNYFHTRTSRYTQAISTLWFFKHLTA